MRKQIIFDKRARKELGKFSRVVRNKFIALLEVLEETGVLEEPFAKKIHHKKGLFEIRVKHRGQYRVIYAYLLKNQIIVLSAFQKKMQKTPLKEIDKAIKRLDNLIKGG